MVLIVLAWAVEVEVMCQLNTSLGFLNTGVAIHLVGLAELFNVAYFLRSMPAAAKAALEIIGNACGGFGESIAFGLLLVVPDPYDPSAIPFVV